MVFAKNYRLDPELNTVMEYYYWDSNYTLERIEIINIIESYLRIM